VTPDSILAFESLRRFVFLWFVSAPITQCRLLAGQPSAAAVAALASAFVGCAWLDAVSPRRRIPPSVLNALGLAVGVVSIVWFMRGGRFAWDGTVDGAQNWWYFAGLRQAVVQNEIPYYVYMAQHGTERYIANVETTIGPHATLLKAMDISSFFVAQLLLCAAVGYVGLLRLKRELTMSTFSWSLFVVVFFFNGYLIAQLSVIRTQWAALYLLPWLFVSSVRLTAGDMSMKNAGALAFTLAAIIYLGAWHIFMWGVMFLLFLSIWSVPSIAFAVKALVMAALLASARLVPALLTFGVGENNSVGGFDRLTSCVQALAAGGVAPNEDLQWYDYDMYVGYVGFALVCLGTIGQRSGSLRQLNKLLVPVVVLLVLSYGHVYERTLFRLPGFVSERYASRFVIVPTLVLTLLGCVRLDQLMKTRARWYWARMLSLLGAAWFLIVQLVLRASYTRPATTGRGMVLSLDALKHVPVEPAYWWSIWIGVTISAVTLAWFACASHLCSLHGDLSER
jgi:hypothetical protein